MVSTFVSARDNEVDDEDSGASLLAANRITLDEQQLLDRNGDLDTAMLFHSWDRGKGQSFAVSLSYVEQDLDGDAMSIDGYSLQVTDVMAL